MGGNVSFRKIGVILRWEYRQKVTSRAFLFSLFFLPFVLITFTALPAYLSERASDAVTIGVSALERPAYGEFAHQVGVRHSDWSIVEVDPHMSIDHARTLVSGKTLDAVVIMNSPSIIYASNFKSAAELELMLTRYWWGSVWQKQTHEAQSFQVARIAVDMKDGQLENYITGLILVLAIFFAIFNSAGSFMRGFLEERASRVLELLISSTKPLEMMAGKIIGLALVGLTQIVVWGMVAWMMGAHHWTQSFVGSSGAWIVVYFVLGYFFYAAVFGTLGAVFTSESDIQPVQSVLSIAGVIPIALSVLVLDQPDSMLVHVLSHIPFVTPTIMVLRIAVASPPTMELVSAAAVLLVSGMVMMKIAAALFDRAARFQQFRKSTG